MLAPLKPVDPDGLRRLFFFEKKASLERYASSYVIHQDDLVALILECKQSGSPFVHHSAFRERIPRHLVPSEADRLALSANGPGPLSPAARKTLGKVTKWQKDGRTLGGHMFTSADAGMWHVMFLDEHDLTDGSESHWVGGAHIHFVNWLWSGLDLNLVWSSFIHEDRRPSAGFHIRYRAEAA
jgi:hypothetical protein